MQIDRQGEHRPTGDADSDHKINIGTRGGNMVLSTWPENPICPRRYCCDVSMISHFSRQKVVRVKTILISHFYLLSDERKGRESVCVKRRKKKGRGDSDPNGIGL